MRDFDEHYEAYRRRDSSLDGVAPFEAFLPVVTVVGRLTIEPIEIR